ncbi:MAG: site-specific DNA-methyltransferase [Candidatus Nomurabacteria bacterium]|jgi:site-specific DNA-methyltransferase (adenine-specific)|nr:site-specific DNA-methyltransferase [Candidatus Nomurabacteria bacterium]
MKINAIYLSDVFDFLKKVKPHSVDLAVIDPPYNMKKAEWDTFESRKDFFDFTFKWIDALLPALKETASLYIFNTPFNAAYILRYLVDRGLVFQNWITWDKRDGFNSSKRRYTHGQETILFFTKTKKYVFNYDEIRVPYESTTRIAAAAKTGLLKNGKRWFPNPDGRLCGEVWHIASERQNRKIGGRVQKLAHPTEKPQAMIERIIKASSKVGDLVLDCFSGSGTTAVCAKRLGRNFICADNNAEYVDLARRRVREIPKCL